MKDLYRYRDLIATLVIRDLKVRYRRSSIGFVWTMLQPLLMLIVLHFVFAQIFAIRFGLRNYTIYALAGILWWNFFQQSVVTSMNSLRTNSYILQKLPVPLMVFPISTTISGVINLLFAMVPMFLMLYFTGHPMGPSLFFLPVAIVLGAMFTLGAGLILSPLSVFFNDVVELVGVGMTLLYFLNPVIYPKTLVEEHSWYWIVHYSPIRSVLEVFRDPIYYNKVPPMTHLTVTIVVALGAFVVGLIAFRRSSGRIAYYL